MRLPSEYHLAIQASIHAANAIMEIYNTPFETFTKSDSSPLTEADLRSSQTIRSYLDKTPHPIVDEESENASFSVRKNWARWWCVDPLDGTKEFVQKNGEFAVNIALIEKDKPIFGIIAAPVSQRVMFGGKGLGVFYISFSDFDTAKTWPLIVPKPFDYPLRMIGSKSHHSEAVSTMIQTLKGADSNLQFIQRGSSLKFIDLVLGDAQIYPRFSPTMEWDIAAGQALLEAVGGEVINFDNGSPLSYNKEELVNPAFVAKIHSFPKL